MTTSTSTAPFSIVCLSSQDWHSALPTNRQQIMLRAAAAGHEVVFVETGRFLGHHLWELVTGNRRRSLARRLLTGERAAPNIVVRKALNLAPRAQSSPLANAVNSATTALLVRRLLHKLPQPTAIWLYDPCVAGALRWTNGTPVAYDCVDDYVEQVGDDQRRRRVVAAGDERAATHSRLVFTTSRFLQAKQLRRNPRTHLVRNVGDFAHFAPAADRRHCARELIDLRRPVLGFAGNLLAGKVDFELIAEVARARPDWTFLLVGPAHSDTQDAVKSLARLPNVRWAGPQQYAKLPPFVAAFDVGLIPYLDNAYTRSCFPLKLFEYLAAGKPVVASGLPELAGMEPDVQLAAGPAEFERRVEIALRLLDSEGCDRRQAIAAANTWESRAATQLQLMQSELEV